MWYVISYESLRDMYDQIYLVMDSIMNERIPKKNEELNNDVIEYERMHKNVLADVEELIRSLKIAMEAAKKGVGSFN